MEYRNLLKAFFLIFVIGNFGSKAVKLSVDFNFPDGVVRVGTNVTYTCRVEVIDGTELKSDMISITKVADTKNEPITLGANKFGLYQKIDRYRIHSYSEGQVTIYELNINGVQVEDSGQYRCVDALEIGNAASASIMVYSEIDNVQFHGVGDILSIWHEDEVNITCYITSSIPEATAHIHAVNYEYTELFHKTVNSRIINEADTTQLDKPPMYIDYDTVYTASTFKARPEDDGKELTCSAEVPGIKGGAPPVKATIKLEVTYPPLFFDCKSRQYALLNEEDVRLNCSVRYNPQGSAEWSFMWAGSEVTLKPDESTDDGEITAMVMREEEGSNAHRMYLFIKKVYEKHFQTYTLNAENEHGNMDAQIILVEGEEPPSGSNSLLASCLVTMVAAFLSKLMWF